LVFLLASGSATFADDVVVTECGEIVAAGRTAYLLEDLDCRGSGTEGVILSHRARLVLGGHTITGDPAEVASSGAPLQGVRCETGSVCSIDGPGAIVGFSASGVAGTRVRVRDVWIGDNAKAGVSAFENVKLRDVVIDNGSLAVHAGGRVHASGADLGENPETKVVEWRAPKFRPGDGSGG
jgi:hypothetical protein